MASIAASLTAGGTAKSGWPIERLIGLRSVRASSKTLRMPELSKACVRWAIQGCDIGRSNFNTEARRTRRHTERIFTYHEKTRRRKARKCKEKVLRFVFSNFCAFVIRPLKNS